MICLEELKATKPRLEERMGIQKAGKRERAVPGSNAHSVPSWRRRLWGSLVGRLGVPWVAH